MNLFTLATKFAALLSKPAAFLVPVNAAQSLSNCVLDDGTIAAQKVPGASVQPLQAGVYRSIYRFLGNWVNDAASVTIAWQYVEFQGKLIRVAAGQTPQMSADGAAWYNLGVTAPASAPTLADHGGGGALSVGTYYYYVTYVSPLGGESAPSAISAGITLVANHSVDLSAIPTSGGQVRKIYRLGGTLATINLVATMNGTDVILNDNIADIAVGASLQTTTYGVPGQLAWIAISPYGLLFGGIGQNVYYCQPGLPQAWPATNLLTFSENTVAGMAYSGAMVIVTTAQPYEVTGNTPGAFDIVGIPAQQGCLERDTFVDMGFALFWLSPDGICSLEGRTVTVISKLALADSLLSNPGSASPTNAKAVRYNERYILFFQASGSASFPAGGYVEWNQRTDGNWLTGTITATAVHYNRTDDAMYIANGDNLVRQYESGATAAGFYRTGQRVLKSYSMLKHWKQGAIDHSGNLAVTVTVDGVAILTSQSLTQSTTIQRSRFRFPAGARGRAIDYQVNWDAGYVGSIVEILDNVQRKSVQL